MTGKTEHRELPCGTVEVMTVDGIADEIGDAYDEQIWDLKGEIFEAMKTRKMIPEDAEGPDYEDMIKEVLDELWRRP